MKIHQIDKKIREEVEKDLSFLVKTYGFKKVRLIANHFLKGISDKEKLEKEIKSKEEELAKLKKKI